MNGSKNDVDDKRFFHPTNKQSIKVMVSACLTWYGSTKPFFANGKGLKVNSKTYENHLEKELIPDTERIMKRRDWMFVRDSAPAHRSNLVQDFLTEKTDKRFIKHSEWPSASTDCNPLG